MGRGADSQLVAVPISMAEALPKDFDFLHAYQTMVWEHQTVWDDADHQSIRGLDPLRYMITGLEKEFYETTGPDQIEPTYSRLGVLVVTSIGIPLLPVGEVTPTATERHLKEFGDTSWYLSNMLKILGISFRDIIEPSIEAWHIDNRSDPQRPERLALRAERALPCIKFFKYGGELISLSNLLLASQATSNTSGLSPSMVEVLAIASGKFTLAMMHLLSSRFGITYEEILLGNNAKIAKRIIEGTVFSETGGDDR